MTRFKRQGATDMDPSLTVMTRRSADWSTLSKLAAASKADAVKLLCNANAQVHARKPSDKVLRYANRYFLTDPKHIAADDLLMIRMVITKIWNGLAGDVTLKIGQSTKAGHVIARPGEASTKSYHTQHVSAEDGVMERVGAIHMAPDSVRDGRFGVVTLIHEASHKYAGTMDYCYFDDDGKAPETAFTNKAKALANADSYGWFVLRVGRSFFGSYYSGMYSWGSPAGA